VCLQQWRLWWWWLRPCCAMCWWCCCVFMVYMLWFPVSTAEALLAPVCVASSSLVCSSHGALWCRRGGHGQKLWRVALECSVLSLLWLQCLRNLVPCRRSGLQPIGCACGRVLPLAMLQHAGLGTACAPAVFIACTCPLGVGDVRWRPGLRAHRLGWLAARRVGTCSLTPSVCGS
jgi:hypothetical protein